MNIFSSSPFKRLLFVCCCLFAITKGHTQLNNEWIDYSKTYYKFRVGKNGLNRIPSSALSAAGMSTIPAQNFQLWRNGVQVPIYLSVSTGILSASDYIEFYGIMNDGKPDKDLYRTAAYQLNDRSSLYTDSSSYFLTYNTTGNNARIISAANNVAANVLPVDPFLMYTEKYDFKEFINRGYANTDYGEYIYSSSYDIGEMLSSNEIYSDTTYLENQPTWVPSEIYKRNFYPYRLGNNPCTIKLTAAGTALNKRDVTIGLKPNNNMATMSLDFFDAKSQTYTNISVNNIPTGEGTYIIHNKCVNKNDRIVINAIDITYPRLYRFNNQQSFEFELPAHSGKYLEITDFNRGAALPVLYDLTNNRRYVAEIGGTGAIRFALPASGISQFVLLSQDNSHINTITNLKQRNFIDYSAAALQGDYLIISNSLLSAPINGTSPVEQYRLYRNSVAGGSYNAKVYDVDQLEDQFGFGIKKHTSSVRNFLRYARQKFTAQPKFAFLIGKGVSYQNFRFRQDLSKSDALNLVPTFGWPGSDNLLSSATQDPYPTTPIGRLSVVSGAEIIAYLDKVKQYELAQKSTSQTQADKAWMKNVVHVVGANDAGLSSLLEYYMGGFKSIISDTLFGASVATLNKFNSGTATNIQSQLLNQEFQGGMSLLTYFGHSSATALDYNLDDPFNYDNPGKYPMFMLLGCNAGDFFDMDTTRFVNKTTISEKFVLAAGRGSIGLIASTHFGLTGGLNNYSTGFYRSVTSKSYGQAVGKNIQDAISYSYNPAFPDYISRIHAEEQTFHGDPSIKMNSSTLPDYDIEEPNIVINPTYISVAESQFNVKVNYYNIGKAVGDSIVINVKRQYPVSATNPSGLTETVYSKKVLGTPYTDSILITLPIIANRDKGTNRIIVTLDSANTVTELSETNNTAGKDFEIFEDEMRPSFPYNFSIVNKQNIKFFGTTSNPFATSKAYRMEMDTTELFNSPIKVVRNFTAAGGVAEIDPGITYVENTVYYWRLGVVSASGNPLRWNTSSFVYLGTSSAGFNQSHVYQHLKSSTDRIKIDSFSRKWDFLTRFNNLFVTQSVFGASGEEEGHFSVAVNNQQIIASACVGHSIIFNVFDPVTFKARENPNKYLGSADNSCGVQRKYNFEWDDRSRSNRDSMRRFMDSIPNGYYVVVRKFLDGPYDQETFAPIMKTDQLTYGVGNTLYDRLKFAGFTDLDSFNRPRTFSFIYKKGDPNFVPKWKLSDALERIQLSVFTPTPDTLGYIKSPLMGPAKAWKNVIWRGNSIDATQGDVPTVDVIGVNNAGVETKLYTLLPTQQDFNISSINAKTYPFMRLQMRNADSIHGTAYNLNYWRLLYDPVPEGALAPNIALTVTDTIEQAQIYNLKIAFKNISDIPFDSTMAIRAVVTDVKNNQTVIAIPKGKKLIAGDTLMISVPLDSKNFSGMNNLYLDVNPNNDQPEQYHYNNFLYRNFFVRADNINPILDVTFDGIHILNRDIVSSKPHIQIKLKDESKFMALNDTSLMKLVLRYPDGTSRTYNFGTDTLRFTPANLSTGDNTATIDFLPDLNQDSEARDYELVVTGKDVSANKAGPSEYRISFQVFNKPMISNMFNYPNPFTTSTAFVFTITGHQIPQEFKIQILTITGKIVREVTKQELGNLNIGRNITEFKWDGTDQYGSKLANGVYLYRVITGLDGKKMDQFRINDNFDQQVQDNTDKYFNKGYGKMYLMR